MPRSLVAASLSLAILGGAVGAAQAQQPKALEIMQSAKASLGMRGPQTGDPTLRLLRLSRVLPKLEGNARRQAIGLLARPTDNPDPDGQGYRTNEAPKSPSCTDHFCVHWTKTGVDKPSLTDGNSDGIPDYVELVKSSAEHSAQVENTDLGWRRPKSDGRKGGSRGKTDIYISALSGGLFGYAAPDPDQESPNGGIARSLKAYLVVDHSYGPKRFPNTNAVEALQVTLAHEYNHILQFSYDAWQDTWMLESTATWMERMVYPAIRDYLRYLPEWTRSSRVPMASSGRKVYGSGVWNQWLAQAYGPRLIRRAWAGARKARPAGFSIDAYDRAIRAADGAPFFRQFTDFAADTAEWRTPGPFPEGNLFPDMQRQGTLSMGRPYKTRILSHTTFRLLKITPSPGSRVAVTVKVPVGVAGGVAVVGRTGSTSGGSVVSDRAYAAISHSKRQGRLRVSLPDPNSYSRLTAVVVNPDSKTIGFDSVRQTWRYRADRVKFRVRGALRP